MISIHRSLAGPDLDALSERRAGSYFNPQVPCGTRRFRSARSFRIRHFNPQVPCGTRPCLGCMPAACTPFQSTGPLRDPTFFAADTSDLTKDFNPQVPCGTRRLYGRIPDCLMRFQSTGPLRDPTTTMSRLLAMADISIHRSLAGPDFDGHKSDVTKFEISIHRSLAGPDVDPAEDLRRQAYFNPQVPCGTRPPG